MVTSDIQTNICTFQFIYIKKKPLRGGFFFIYFLYVPLVKTYRDVDVSNNKPTGKARVWVNTASNDTESQDILLPQVDDNNVSEENTWSSKKIDSEIGEVREGLEEHSLNTRVRYKSSNLADPKQFSSGYIAEKVTEHSAYMHTGYIRCHPGDVIHFLKTKNISEYLHLIFYDKNKDFVAKSYVSDSEYGDETPAQYTVPNNSDIYYCVANFWKDCANQVMVTINTEYPSEYETFYDYEYLKGANEKEIIGTILVAGDSIAYGAGYTGGYANIIAKRNPKANIINYGISGTTVSVRDGYNNSVVEIIDTMQGEADHVILEGGVNDSWCEIEFGQYDLSGNLSPSTIFDEHTFCGAVESMFMKAHEKWPNAIIYYIIPMVADKYYTNKYLSAARELCTKWGIVPIDIRESGLCFCNAKIKEAYSYNGDGVHPNSAGYEKFYVPWIEKAIRTFI